MSISINKISKAYNNELALKNISFNIKKGEIVGFLGPNGAGKSTLMKIICGSLKQDKGEVRICKINSKKNMLLVKSKIGYLSEKNPLYLDMYVKEYLTFIGNIYNIKNLKYAINNIVFKFDLLKFLEIGIVFANVISFFLMFFGISPVAGSINLICSHTILSDGLSEG